MPSMYKCRIHTYNIYIYNIIYIYIYKIYIEVWWTDQKLGRGLALILFRLTSWRTQTCKIERKLGAVLGMNGGRLLLENAGSGWCTIWNTQIIGPYRSTLKSTKSIQHCRPSLENKSNEFYSSVLMGKMHDAKSLGGT